MGRITIMVFEAQKIIFEKHARSINAVLLALKDSKRNNFAKLANHIRKFQDRYERNRKKGSLCEEFYKQEIQLCTNIKGYSTVVKQMGDDLTFLHIFHLTSRKNDKREPISTYLSLINFHNLKSKIATILSQINLILYKSTKETDTSKNNKIVIDVDTLNVLVLELKHLFQLVDLINICTKQGVFDVDLLKNNYELTELVKNTLLSLKYYIESKPITIHENLSQEIRINTNKESLLAVLYVILHNAIKYSPEGGEVYIQIAKKESDVRLSVENEVQGLNFQEIIEFRKFLETCGKEGNLPGLKQKAGSRMGLLLTKKILSALDIEFNLSCCDNGLRIELDFKN